MKSLKEIKAEQKQKRIEFKTKHPKIYKALKYGAIFGAGAATILVGEKVSDKILNELPDKSEWKSLDDTIDSEDYVESEVDDSEEEAS